MLPVVVGAIVVAGAGAGYEIGKDLGWWGAPAAPVKKMPPPGVVNTTGDGHPILVGDPALDMNAMLKWTGYRLVDQPVYKAFQSSAGLTADGYPGSHTMAALKTVLQAKGVQQQDVYPGPVYPWLKAPGYDGVNAPTVATWTRGMPASHPQTTNPNGPTNEAGGLPKPNLDGSVSVLTSTGYVSPAAALAGVAGQVGQAITAEQAAVVKGAQTGIIAAIEDTAKAAEAAVGG